MNGPVVSVAISAPPTSVVRAVHSTDEAGLKVISIHVHLWDLSGEADLAAGGQCDLDIGQGRKFDAIGGGKLVFVSNDVPLAELVKAVGLIVDHGGVLPEIITASAPFSLDSGRQL